MTYFYGFNAREVGDFIFQKDRQRRVAIEMVCVMFQVSLCFDMLAAIGSEADSVEMIVARRGNERSTSVTLSALIHLA